MTLNISFRHMEPSDTLKKVIQDKSKTFSKYFQGKIHAAWTLTLEKQFKVAHCHIVGNNMDYFGEASTEDFRTSVDEVLEKIEKQVRKHKEIVTNKLHK